MKREKSRVKKKENKKRSQKERRKGPFRRQGVKIEVKVSREESESVRGVSSCVRRGGKRKKFQRRESNPRLKRERLECYRLHHIGLSHLEEEKVHQSGV